MGNSNTVKKTNHSGIVTITTYGSARVLHIANGHITNITTQDNGKMTVRCINGQTYDQIDIIAPPIKTEKSQTSGERMQSCVYCLDHSVQVVIVDCGHFCLCTGCANKLVSNGKFDCPKCRKRMTRIVCVYN